MPPINNPEAKDEGIMRAQTEQIRSPSQRCEYEEDKNAMPAGEQRERKMRRNAARIQRKSFLEGYTAENTGRWKGGKE